MKNKKSFLIIIFAFVVLFSGATVLYNSLRSGNGTDQLNLTYGQAPAPTDTSVETEPTSQSAVSETEAASEPETEQEPELTLAPDFTVYDLDGNEVHLSDYIGKAIVLNFWASWCGPCKNEMPDFEEAYLELGEEVQFLMINVTVGRETLESASAFIAEQGYTFPVFYDIQSDAAATYGAYSLPTTYFIDAEGYGIAQAVGSINREILQKGIDMILQE